MFGEKLLLHKNNISSYLSTGAKWVLFSVVIGIFGAAVGCFFHLLVDKATVFRTDNPKIIYLLPIAGLLIVFLYKICSLENDKGTNRIISAVREKEKIPFILAPVIIIATFLTHLCGGSSGREGAALQIGGSIGSLFSKIFKTRDFDTSVCIMCGMSAVFSAVFTTPVTAAVFSLEVISVGILTYSALFPVLLSSCVAYMISGFFGVAPTKFAISSLPHFDFLSLVKVSLFSVAVSLVGIFFVYAMHKSSHLCNKISNKYLRVLTGSAIVIVLTFLSGTYDYNGAGMDIVTVALEDGFARPEAFLLKILFTAITLGAGFKGGEIVPTFFIGSVFGAFFAPFIGLDASFGAAVGLIALFCSVSNCPVSSIILSIELFGSDSLAMFAIAVAVSYIFSGYSGLYSSQKIMYSKLNFDYLNINTR